MSSCRVCSGKTPAFLCASCAAELQRAIAELPSDLRDLQLVAARQALGPLGLGDRRRQWDGPFEDGSLGDAPWDFAPGAADQIWALLNTVIGWCRHIAETRKVQMPAHDRVTRRLVIDRNRAAWRHYVWPATINTLCTWLVSSLNAIRYDEAAAEIHDEFVGLHTENDRWILGHSGVEVFAGPCDATQVTFELDPSGNLTPKAATCGTPLYGYDNETEVRCRTCGTRYELQPRLDEIRERQINDQLAPAHRIADALTTLEEPLGHELLRKWIQRDALRDPAPEGPACETCKHSTCKAIRRPPIHAQGVDDKARPLYRFGDVRRRLQLVQEQRGARLSA